MRSRLPALPLLAILLLTPALAIAQPPPPPPPPTPLPPPPVPAGNPITAAKANLGKVLFWDEQMSSTRTVACGSCHQGASGGSDPRSLRGSARATHPGLDGTFGTPDDVTGSPGVPLVADGGAYLLSTHYGTREQVTPRVANSHVNAAYAPSLFWDGRAGGTFVDPVGGATVLAAGGALESQAVGPPTSATEMAHEGRDWLEVAARIATSRPLALATFVPTALATWIDGRDYGALFAEAFGSPAVTPVRIALAIATYERTQFSTQTPFDSAIAGTAVLTPQENAGRQLFATLPCARCHAGSLLSDNAFHYIGVRPAAEDSGRMVVTHAPQDLGAFRTPSLRNVALRRSFMHNGRFATLEQVVDFYDRGGDFTAPNKSPLITPLNLTPLQKAQLLAFLRRPLTDPRVAAETAPFDHPSLFSESELVPRVEGIGVAGAGGLAPVPTALEPPLAGNPAFTVAVSSALGGAAAVLAIDDADPGVDAIPADAELARVEVVLGGAGVGAGFGSAMIAIPDDPALHGRTFFARWYVADPAAPNGVAVSPLVTFRVFGAGGQGVLAAGDPLPVALGGGVRLTTGFPNPFRGSTSFRYELFATSAVRLTVHDLRGRAVRTLVDEPLRLSGRYSASWDGRDDRGQAAPAGVYYVRLAGGTASDARKVVKLD
jgi:cytochrome c peroxidase